MSPTEETVCLPCITSVERTTRSGIVPPVRQGGGSTTPSSSTRNHRNRRRRAFDTVVMPVALSARGIRREGAIAQIDFDKPGGRAYLDGLAVQGTTNELDKRHSLDSLGSSHQDRKSTRLKSSHGSNSYAGLCLKKKTNVALVPGFMTSIVTMYLLNINRDQ